VGGYKAWNGIGDCLVALGDHREAVKAYTKALQSNRRVLLPVVSLTSILLDHDEPREVLAFLERLTDMSDVDTLAILAHTFGVKGCHEEALDILRLAQKIEPQQRLEFMTGETLLNLGRYAEAVEVFRALPAGSQYRVPALLDQVFCELVTGRFTEAEQCLAEVPGEYAPVSAACRALLDAAAGREPLLTGEEEEMARTREAVWNLLQKLLEARSFELFEQALALVPAAGIEPGPAALRLGKLYRSQGYDDSAIEELETALTLGEADAESLGILGDICRARGLAEEAVNFYQEAIAHDPSRLVLHTSLVASLATLRQYAEAAAALRSALRHLPSSGLLKETLSSMEALAGSASAVATGADDAS
jgi:tetratricopeptide (TPR) repeat protein